MTKRQTIVATFLLGALLGGAVAKPVQAAGDELGGVVRALNKIADALSELGEIRRNGVKCRE